MACARGVDGGEGGWKRFEKFGKVDLLMLSAGPPEGGFVPKPPFHREHQDTSKIHALSSTRFTRSACITLCSLGWLCQVSHESWRERCLVVPWSMV